MTRQPEKFKFTSFDDLFGAPKRDEDGDVVVLSVSHLLEFEKHPFHVTENEDMEKLIESIKENGVINPIIVRPKNDGMYEVISGHRRLFASKKAGLMEIRAIIRDMTDDEAVIAMVDSNIQRENILPSEKARAYAMKYEALKHRGVQRERHSVDIIGEEFGESGKTVQRYIRADKLISQLKGYLDEGRLGLTQAVELSFLSERDQEEVYVAMEETGKNPSKKDAARLKEIYKERGSISVSDVEALIDIKKEAAPKYIKIPVAGLDEYLPGKVDIDVLQKRFIEFLKTYGHESSAGQ